MINLLKSWIKRIFNFKNKGKKENIDTLEININNVKERPISEVKINKENIENELIISIKRNKFNFANMSPYELGESKEKDAIIYLKTFLEDGNENEKRLAASAVGKLIILYKKECQELKDCLINNLNNEKAQVRNYTLKTLKHYDNITDKDLALLEEKYLSEEKEYNLKLFEEILKKHKGEVSKFELKRSKKIEIYEQLKNNNNGEIIKDIIVKTKKDIKDLERNKLKVNKILENYKDELDIFNLSKIKVNQILQYKREFMEEEIDKIKLIKNCYEEIIYNLIEGSDISERESIMFRLRYEGYTLQDIGDRFNLSRERIRQIISKAIIKMKSEFNKSKEINNMLFKEMTYKIIGQEGDLKLHRMAIFIIHGYGEKKGIYKTIMPILFNKEEIITIEKIIIKYNETKKEIIRNEFLISEANKRFEEKILNKVIWPVQLKKIEIKDYNKYAPKRKVNMHGDGINGSFYSDKISKEIEYESQLEFIIINILENSEKVQYYQVQPLVIEYGVNNSKSYYPDIICTLNDGRTFIIEVKPIFNMFEYKNLIKYYALKNYCIKNGYGYVMLDMKMSFEEILNITNEKKLNFEFEKVVLDRLKTNKELRWNDYYKISHNYDVSDMDMYKLIFDKKLFYSSSPFRIKYIDIQ